MGSSNSGSVCVHDDEDGVSEGVEKLEKMDVRTEGCSRGSGESKDSITGVRNAISLIEI